MVTMVQPPDGQAAFLIPVDEKDRFHDVSPRHRELDVHQMGARHAIPQLNPDFPASFEHVNVRGAMFISGVDLDDEAVFENHGRHDSTITQPLGFCKDGFMAAIGTYFSIFIEIIIS
jgi:hypothetical protein